MQPFISIIVPAYNTEKTIRKCIDSLLRIDYPNYEILIIDDGSIDKTREILSEYKNRIILIESRHSGPSKCRNIAAKRSKGDFLAFTDADCLVDKNWLGELMRGFVNPSEYPNGKYRGLFSRFFSLRVDTESPAYGGAECVNDKVVGVGGTQLSPQDETKFGKSVQTFFELTGFLGGYIKQDTRYKIQDTSKNYEDKKSNIRQVSHNPSCNVMYRKDVFLEIGAFDENLWPSEDVDLDHRLKKKGSVFMYNPKAIVYHYRPQSLKQLSKMMFRYGVMQGILTRKYGFFRKIQFMPIVFLPFLILFFLNKNFLWLIPSFYIFVWFKTRDIISSSFIVIFSISSAIIWSIGFLKGLIEK